MFPLHVTITLALKTLTLTTRRHIRQLRAINLENWSFLATALPAAYIWTIPITSADWAAILNRKDIIEGLLSLKEEFCDIVHGAGANDPAEGEECKCERCECIREAREEGGLFEVNKELREVWGFRLY